MRKEFVIALDMGTSGCHAVAVRADGSTAAQCYLPLTPQRTEAGISQYHAAQLDQTARLALHAVLDKVGPQRVASLAIVSQRSTVVLWDKSTGEPVGPVLTWEDGRAQEQAQQAPLSQEEVHLRTGLYKTPFFSAPKIAWMLQHAPQAHQALRRGQLCAAPVASYVVWKLTGGHVFATDYALAQRTLLLNIQTLGWDESLCRAFEIDPNILPTLQPTAADYGTYVYQGIPIPITVCGADQQAAAVYFGLQPQKSLINYGTGAFWLYHTGEKPIFLPGLLTSLGASDNAGKSNYLLEGPVNAAASTLLWLKAQGIAFDEVETDDLCRAAENPLWLLPALGGLGAPYWDFTVSPAVEGLSSRTRKPDWVAGAVRGIAFLLADIGSYLQENGLPVTGPVQISGGLSRVEYLISFQAGLLQIPLEVSSCEDATVLGAALLAFKQIDKNLQFTPDKKTVEPTFSAIRARELYAAWQAFVRRARQVPVHESEKVCGCRHTSSAV